VPFKEYTGVYAAARINIVGGCSNRFILERYVLHGILGQAEKF